MRVRGGLRLLGAWAAASATAAALDLFWLGWAASALYRKALGHLMADRTSWPPALLFYALYGAGVVLFAARPATSLREAALLGAALGLLAYGTYDLTNMAVLRDWGAAISALDVAWGVLLTSLAASASFKARG